MNFAEKLKYKADMNDLNMTVNKEMCYIEKKMEEHFDKREFRINLLVPERTMAIGQNYTNVAEFFVPHRVSPAHYRQLFMDELFKLGFKGFIFMPCELIDKNGETLKSIILKNIMLFYNLYLIH